MGTYIMISPNVYIDKLKICKEKINFFENRGYVKHHLADIYNS